MSWVCVIKYVLGSCCVRGLYQFLRVLVFITSNMKKKVPNTRIPGHGVLNHKFLFFFKKTHFVVHPGGTKMYHDLHRQYYWRNTFGSLFVDVPCVSK